MDACPECGDGFDSEQALWIHRAIEHEDAVDDWDGGGPGQKLMGFLGNPRSSFIIGMFVGLLLAVSVAFSPPAAFEGDPAGIGERTLNHYQDRAPPGVDYDLVGVDNHPSGTHAVTLQVQSGNVASNETVYVTSDGGHVFETPPSEVKADLSALDR